MTMNHARRDLVDDDLCLVINNVFFVENCVPFHFMTGVYQSHTSFIENLLF